MRLSVLFGIVFGLLGSSLSATLHNHGNGDARVETRFPALLPIAGLLAPRHPVRLFLPIQVNYQFPPVIEYFVQKIQSSHSNFVYQDLSRPPASNEPVYTLSPDDQIYFDLAPATTPIPSTTTEKLFDVIEPSTFEEIPQEPFPKPIEFDYGDLSNVSENLFEFIQNGDLDNIPSQSGIVHNKTSINNTESTSITTQKIPNLIDYHPEPAYSIQIIPNIVFFKAVSENTDDLNGFDYTSQTNQENLHYTPGLFN